MRSSFRRGGGHRGGRVPSCKLRRRAAARKFGGASLRARRRRCCAERGADRPSAARRDRRGTPRRARRSANRARHTRRNRNGLPAIVEVSGATPYPPGGRVRAPGAGHASSDDENIARWNRGGWAGATSEVGGDNKPPHPAPRVKVDVLKITGKASEADVLRVARSKGYWPLRLCYEEGLRRD